MKSDNMLKANIRELNHLLGNIDIYLLDQVLKKRFEKRFRILDAGCGEGRNLIYFVGNDYQIYGIDKNTDSIRMLKHLVRSINKSYPLDRFITGDVSDMPYEREEFDAVISSAVFHFADNKTQFLKMIRDSARVLKVGGILFVRMATDMGIENHLKPACDGKYLLPDGSIRFLLTKPLLHQMMDLLGLEFIEPFKTVIVDDKRSMGVLVLRKL